MNVAWDLKSQFETYKDTDAFDCLVAESLLSEGRLVHTQESVLQKYEVSTLDELAVKQQEKLATLPKLKKLYESIELPLISVLYQMERNGILLDTKCLEKVGNEIRDAALILEDEIKKEIGFDINLNSSLQVGNYLTEKEGVPLAKTKTGRFATNESELAQYAEQFPIIKKLLQYRELSKLASTYITTLINKVDEKGRVHTTYNQVFVNTGRLSSANPNLQNIPVTSEYGQKIKACFIAGEGQVLVSFDYSQQELRILAHLTGEERLIEAFKTGKDVHKITASRLFNASYDEVTKKQRNAAKTVNFGIVYGMSKYGLSQGLHISVEEADVFIKTFFETYPKIKTYYDQYLLEGKKNGYVETMLGRRRYVFEYPGQKFIDNNTRRVLINYPIQGTAAELMKKAMIESYEGIKERGDIKMLLQIHDALVFEVKDDPTVLKEFLAKTKEIMCSVYPLSVPNEVDVKIGKNWGEMEKFD